MNPGETTWPSASMVSVAEIALEIADRGDYPVGHADIGTLARQTRSIHDSAALNQKIIRHGDSLSVWKKR